VKSIRVGVIGCGAHGVGGHVAGYAQLEEVEITAVCDTRIECAQEAAAKFGVPNVYGDHQEMLARHELDIVSVCTPAVAHKEGTVDAFRAGAHVLCEKPLAMNALEAEEMIAVARESGKLLSMGLTNRFRASSRWLRDFLVKGELGHIYHTRIRAGHVMHIPGWGVHHVKSQSAGGVLVATAVHPLDLANWVIGNPTPVTASGSWYQKVHRMKSPKVTWQGTLKDCDVEDFADGFVRFADGSTMSIESNWLMHPSSRQEEVEILGDYGVAWCFPLRVELDFGDQVRDATPKDIVEPRNAFFEVVRDFVSCVREERVPVIRFGEMLNVQSIMDGIYRSAELGREVAIH